jgi:GT2 family glycosyltransferase
MKISRWLRRRKETALLRQYFDERFYLREYPDAADAKKSAFEHFMSVGWRRGYDPNDWFSIRDYVEAYPDVGKSGINPFKHFLVHAGREGRYLPYVRQSGRMETNSTDKNLKSSLPPALLEEAKKVEASGYFSKKYYLDMHKDIALQSIDPAVHFCQYGWREGRSPSKLFDVKYFDRNFPRSRNSQVNPVIDFLDSGLDTVFAPNPLGMFRSPPVIAPSEPEWVGLRPAKSDRVDTVDIIVPVYKGHAETLRCLYSVLRAQNHAPVNLVVIDDSSPEPALSADLLRLAQAGLFTLLVNESNLGFVKTVNRGLRLHEDRDVLLLNSDTEVHDHWIDRLLAHARSAQDIATITPLSNNATICSYPQTLVNNSWNLEIPWQEIDSLAGEINKGEVVDVPTGVGFCMYVRRAAIRQVGDLDEGAFDKGYGEENDFCVRTAGAGWRNAMALDTYVRHHGEISFGTGSGVAQAKGLKALIKKHPGYPGLVERYIKTDPARVGRARLDAARIKNALGEVALFLSHDWGGGIERNISDLRADLAEENIAVVVMRSQGKAAEYVCIDAGNGFFTPNLEHLHVNADAALLGDLVRILQPKLIHVHSLAGLGPAARSGAIRLVRESGVPYYFTFHDYSPICPHAQFVTPAGAYCGEPAPGECQSCVNRYPPENGWVDIHIHQSAYRELLSGAKRIFAPSRDTLRRAEAFTARSDCLFSPHREPALAPARVGIVPGLSASRQEKAAVRVAVLGAIGPHKGRDVMESCARDSDARDLPLFFRLIGYSDTGSEDVPRLGVTGEYRDDAECLALLDQYKPHFIAFFSIWPETYSYALSLAFRANVPPVVFDTGAMAERVRESGFGHCLPHQWRHEPGAINDFLVSNPLRPLPRLKHRALLQAMDGKAPGEILSDFYGLDAH